MMLGSLGETQLEKYETHSKEQYSLSPENHTSGSLDLNYFPGESFDLEATVSASGRWQDRYFHAALSLKVTPATPEKELGFPTRLLTTQVSCVWIGIQIQDDSPLWNIW